eukprot:8340155-Pyramimonas_sp.AAC.1
MKHKDVCTKTWPDQWPAVTDEWAEPVEEDTKEMAILRPLLRQTMNRCVNTTPYTCVSLPTNACWYQLLEFVPLGLAYDANKDGWSTSAFHKKLDGMGAALLVAETEGGAVIGGYNPKGWLGYGDWRDAISAFLFTWPTGETTTCEPPSPANHSKQTV